MSIIKSLKSVAIASLAILIPSIALAAGGNLEPNDPVGITFWLISIAMVAATVFFLMESLRVDGKWRTSMVVGGLVTLVAAVHYFYMREVWVATGASPTVFRYVDWLITVPLQMIEFYLILAACTAIAAGVFWRLMVGTMVMLIGGYLGEAGFINATLGFVIGMAGWAYILYEIFAGEAGKVAAEQCSCLRAISVQHNALDCNNRMGYLPARLLLRLHDRWRRCQFIEFNLQRC